MTNQVIPVEAVEAAAKAMLAAGNHVGGWDALPVFMQDNYLRDARAALEAAAPHMLAEAWDEGRDATIEAYDGRGDGSNPYMLNTEGEK